MALAKSADRAIARTAGLALLACMFGGAAQAAADCTLKEVASIPADFSHGGVAIEVGVNGQKVHFLLDTNSNLTQINSGLVQRLGLATVDLHQRTVSSGGTQERRNVLVPDFTLGQMVSHTNTFFMMNGNDGSDGGPAGTLGLDFLGNYDIEIDPTEKRVNLFVPIQCGSAVYWWDDHFELPLALDQYDAPTTRIQLDGNQFTGVIETGEFRSSIDIAVARHKIDIPGEIQAPPPGSDTSLDPVYAFKELIFGPITIRNPKLELRRYRALAAEIGSHIKGSVAEQAPVTIGMDVLGKFHSMISFGSGKLYFTLPNERKPAPAGASK